MKCACCSSLKIKLKCLLTCELHMLLIFTGTFRYGGRRAMYRSYGNEYPEISIDPYSIHSLKAFNDERFHCTNCDRSYRRKEHLKRHQTYECGKEPQFECKLCFKRYKQKSTLKTHMIIHKYKINS